MSAMIVGRQSMDGCPSALSGTRPSTIGRPDHGSGCDQALPDRGSKAGQHDHQNDQAYNQDCREVGFREFQELLDDFKQEVDNDEPNQSDDDQPAYQLEHSSPPKSQGALCTTLLLLMRAAASAMVNSGRASCRGAPALAE
jgi:hypothetical protein